ncbi:adenylate cyclase type 9-like [Amphibalanus amphitrite]|uniref:adenylate cyclase type 9-like n=1 Tax=Amphibalanus amphitrite TaxID=1232801 RepID=UPI001C906DAB|nr:adenylate cyclase type 9-like [Amphibalanus amphitrite]XP_043247657.1 adenylate cyclase type 9-like [Amphibalanus amphitrite]
MEAPPSPTAGAAGPRRTHSLAPDDADSRRPAKLSDLSDLVTVGGRLPGYRSRRPCLFERSAATWWDPRFDSDILEGQYRATTLPRIKRRLQMGLTFSLLAALVWCVYVGTARERLLLALLCLLAVLPLLAALAVTETARLERHLVAVSAVAAAALCLLSLLPAAARLPGLPGGAAVTELQLFAWAAVTVTLVYTMVPLPLYGAVVTSVLYSVTLEALTAAAETEAGVAARLLVRTGLHICLHLIGLRTLVLAQVHMRSTFTTVGQTLLTQRQLELEKQLKEKMIYSVLPRSLADWAQDEMTDPAAVSRSAGHGGADLTLPRPAAAGPEICFRPFNMQPMDQVSILFADIVGFTRMSSNKSAEQLVGLLNDLFGRFDELCTRHGCEKISTLGDCYYCVSGCPEPRADHAICCVQMGLAMIAAIKQFDRDNGEDVNMRVGVHTGRVLCGLVGTQRFKFDVWSNDVSMANKMESSGRPGAVHISEKTLHYLRGQYTVTPGEPVADLQTYFIVRRKTLVSQRSEPTSPNDAGPVPIVPLSQKCCSLPCVIEATDTPARVEPLNELSSLDPHTTRAPRPRPGRPDRDAKGRRQSAAARLHFTTVAGSGNLRPLPEERAASDGEEDDLVDDGVDAAQFRLLGVSMSSFNSRKDSGIRSRRSSIQAQIAALNGMKSGDLLTHRMSGYYTSSQSSLMDASNLDMMQRVLDEADALDQQEPEHLLAQQLMQRKLSDLQLVRCVQQMSNKSNYFINPPINRLTLFYKNADFERQYRLQHARRHHAAANALSLPKYNTLVDAVVATIVFVVLAVAVAATLRPAAGWFAVTALLAAWLALVQGVMWWRLAAGVSRDEREPFARAYCWLTGWYPFHVIGGSLAALPAVVVFAGWSCAAWSGDCERAEYYFLAMLVALVHFCNFTQLNCWLKSALAAVAALAMALLVGFSACRCGDDQRLLPTADLSAAMAALVALVAILNREFEISYRLGFCVNMIAARDKAEVQRLKQQADGLLHNIIPEHVADVLKTKAKYSENHRDVGVLFASIINFNDLYDETYHGGKEYLRVLNEIIGDMDDLLHKYTSVEKIKTIGSTYMAASGLNPSLRRDTARPDQHLFELMEFAMDLQKAVAAFNVSLFEFALELRIGYNIGDVTSGVIGTTKLYFDIWGDTVNIASRMDSTGEPGRIQTTQRCALLLAPRFDFERRGEVFVKGKDHMVTYYLKGPRVGGGSAVS